MYPPFIAGLPRGYIYQETESNATNKIVIWPILRLGDYYQAVNATYNYLLLEMMKKLPTLKDLRISFIKFTFLQKTVSPATISWIQLRSGEIGRCVTISLFAGLILPNSYIYANRCLAGKLKTLLSCSKRRHRRREGSLLGIRDLLFL